MIKFSKFLLVLHSRQIEKSPKWIYRFIDLQKKKETPSMSFINLNTDLKFSLIIFTSFWKIVRMIFFILFHVP